MLIEEARWFRAQIALLDKDDLFPMLNVGSSTADFRINKQSWIDEHVFRPAAARGGRVVHVDIKRAPGVDMAGDLTDPAFRAELTGLGARSVFCSNLLEHVRDRQAICAALVTVLPPGGYLAVSCPRRYPRHDDPIDTLLRPSVQELAAMFPGADIVAGETVVGGTYFDALGRSPARLAKELLRACLPFYAPARWLGTLRHLAWLHRRFEATCVILRRPG